MSQNVIQRLQGAFPVLVTPFRDDESLDLESLGLLLDRVLEGGLRGITLLGSSAESTYMTADERATVLEVCARKVGDSIPKITGCLRWGTRDAVEEGKRLRDLGADALLVGVPQYFATGFAGVVRHFSAIRQKVGLPVLYYHYPKPMHLDLSPGEVSQLFEEVDLCGIKNSSLDSGSVLAQLAAIKRPIRMFTGQSFDALACLHGGAVGSICVVSLLMPKTANALTDAVAAGDADAAREKQNAFYSALPVVVPEVMDGNPIGVAHAGVKEVLYQAGIIRSARVRNPQPQLSCKKRNEARLAGAKVLEL